MTTDDALGGVWSDGRLTVALTGDGARYAGTLRFQAQEHPLRAAAVDGGLEGAFDAGGASFPFVAWRDGAALVLESGGARYVLARQAPPANPLAAAPPANPLAAPPAADDGTAYRHPLGVTFRHPPAWSVHETPVGLALVPQDVGRNAWGPAELYLVTAAPAPGIARPDDPRVEQHLTLVLGQMVPAIRRVGPPEAVASAAGPGVALTWEGAAPPHLGGAAVLARAFVVLRAGDALGVFAIGEPARVRAREPVVRAVFASLGLAPRATDPRLVGTWYAKNYTRVASYVPDDPNAALSAVSVQHTSLLPDGTTVRGGATAYSGPYGMGEAAQGGARGRWAADGGRLYLVSPEGATVAYQYFVQGSLGRREALLTSLDGKKTLWTEYPD